MKRIIIPWNLIHIPNYFKNYIYCNYLPEKTKSTHIYCNLNLYTEHQLQALENYLALGRFKWTQALFQRSQLPFQSCVSANKTLSISDMGVSLSSTSIALDKSFLGGAVMDNKQKRRRKPSEIENNSYLYKHVCLIFI